MKCKNCGNKSKEYYCLNCDDGGRRTKKPKLMNQGHTDEIFTPKYALEPLLPFLKGFNLVWECAWGKGSLAKHLEEKGFEVFGDKSKDFLETNISMENYDIIITNPPYSIKDKFLEHCYKGGRPFALLMPLTALEGIKRGALYKKYGIQLIIPNRRIDFIMPNKQGNSWFQVAWFTWGLNLPKDLMFVELNKSEEKE